jgi:putative tricarboxylic transport membrane protein
VRGQTTERLSGLFILLLGIAILWQGKGLSVGTFRAPGAGFFPLLLGVTLIVLSFFQIIRGAKDDRDLSPFTARRLVRVSMVFAALVVYFVFLEYLGFLVMSFLLMAFCFVWVARYKWYAALLWAFVSIVVAHLLFDVLLKSSLPKGVLGI